MSTLTSAPHFLAFLISLWILSLAADHPEVIVKAGEDVTLQCQAPRDAQINMFEWIRPDLESDGYIFRFIPGQSTTRNQLPSYQGRVELRDPDMKDGDLSVVLKKVSVSDTGTYQCRVGIREGEKPKVYSTIQLTVSDHPEVIVKAGEDVTLQCQAPRGDQINMLEWIRPDLESGGHIFRFIPGESTTRNQHPSYQGRVELRDPDMKDGDLSVVLKKVSVSDTGTYRCRVGISGGGKPKVYSAIQLTVSDHPEVIVKAGEDVTLHCQAPRDAQINMFEWIRPDLESGGYIFRFIPGESTTVNQHSSYRGRVELRDPDMKDGDLSVVLKDVSVSDTGTYRCRVGIREGGKPKVYSTIQLIVSGSEDGNSSLVGLLVGLAAVGLVLGAVAVAGFLKYKRYESVVKAYPGDNVTLPYLTAYPSIRAVKWTRPDLKPDTVLCYNDRQFYTDDQNQSFKDRLELADTYMNGGDLSLTLKKVSRKDSGTYKCRVKPDDSKWKSILEPIRTFHLQVPDMIEVPVLPGQDAILPCRSADPSIRVLLWSRADQKPYNTLLCRTVKVDKDEQHESYKDRVELVDKDLKNGVVSLILKKVSRHDTGRYMCRVETGDQNVIKKRLDSDPIRIIYLQVTDEIVKVRTGQDVILPCQAADPSISIVEWRRPDLEPDIVLLYSDGHLKTEGQHSSFKDRVELVNRELKNGDMSFTLKNVNINDTGAYECRVESDSKSKKRANTNSEPIRIIYLQVTDPDSLRIETPLLKTDTED